MSNEGIVAPFIRYDAIGRMAEAFIAKHHPTRAIPVPVEDIIETQLRIDIFPVAGLTKALSSEDDGVVAYVNSSLDLITVDRDAWEQHTARYRFSIAHELGHIVLHASVFAKLKADSIADWKEAMRSIPKQEYGWLEWQANCFAGLLLAPTQELRENLDSYLARAGAEGLTPGDEPVRWFAEKHLGAIFGVSPEVVRIRIDKEGLWPQP
jgi:hypothetical protein